MKRKGILFIYLKLNWVLSIFIIILFISPLTAQITIERSDFTLEANSTVTEWIVSFTNITIPTEGANQIWDYSDIAYTNSYSYTKQDTSHPNMASVNLSTSSGVLQLGGVYQPRTWFEALESDEYATIGMNTEAISASLGAVTGDINDSINYLGELNIYQEPLVLYKWPISFNDSWDSNISFNTETTLTVNALGLNQVAGTQISYNTTTSSVSSYGNLLLPNPIDTSEVLDLEVLLIKEESTTVDSVFINGTPASSSLLNSFNMTQGNITNTVNYRFMAKNLPNAAFTIEYIDGSISFTAVSNEISNVVNSIFTLSEDEKTISIFPNPITDATEISFDNEWVGNISIDIINAHGQKIQSISIEKYDTNITNKLKLTNIAIGVYRAIISYEDDVVIKSFVKIR